MNSKEIILNRIAGAAMPPVDYPAFDFTPLRFEDRTAAFAEAVKAAGGQVVAADGNPLTELIRRYYPDAKTIASVLPEAHATIDPDTVDDARKLIDIDLGVIDGCFGVAENGAVWIRQDIRHKALYFGATALMILIPRDALVDTMHELSPDRNWTTSNTDASCPDRRKPQISNRPWSSGRTVRCRSPSYCGKPHLSTPRPLSGTFSQVPDSSLYDSSVSSVKFPWPTNIRISKTYRTIFNFHPRIILAIFV